MKHSEKQGRSLRILTYNVHRWLGTDRQISPGRIAEVIASCDPDVVALQEVRVGRVRAGEIDQAAAVASTLGMDLHFQPTIRILGEQYGIAVLSRHSSRLIRSERLPTQSAKPSFEKRSALWVAVEVDGQTIQVVNAHLSLRSGERRTQAAALVGPDWMGHPDCADPAVLLGDFNAPPYSRSYRMLANRLRDAQLSNSHGEPQPTFHTRAPVLRLDHVFVTKSIEVLDAGPVRNRLTRIASDHFPLLAELRVRKRAKASIEGHAREGELL
ncbi:endonuclease/exonuclease/phosphatase family metal-dependent hydrolase [Microvirga flocculans]|uniref:Endonuclease/exonuclease/phosphatase family metal-dependent hydrolase n=1 Tax=Microvirga flocculans TaxID=217168 RepID=A0A7W6IDF0_9HYPH|nr:endonuclease/exonuclease/phosphatase family protein [Microvirga flocculans]MBB4039443.1 endonuclease/exonuclease/phosphatase family metal-dependent hydrolase [Microvirga flocculans]